MDLYQQKLSKIEWESIEIPVNQQEQKIIHFIKNGFHNINIKYNDNHALLNFIKLNNTSLLHMYLYEKYFQSHITTLIKTYNLNFTLSTDVKKKEKPKKVDIMKIDNFHSSFKENKNVFEFELIQLCELFLENFHNNKSEYVFYYYTLKKIIQFNIDSPNTYVCQFVDFIIKNYEDTINITYVIKNSPQIIEKNVYLNKYSDTELYNHQKQIFTIFKKKAKEIVIDENTKYYEQIPIDPKLVLYIAPTATGKTLTPIGLSEQYKIIFVCAARHVGLALAKSALSVGKKIALAFNCNNSEDVRLHYSAAKEFTKNYKTGGIHKVDNSVGDNVEIMICDIKSYIPAMYYMCAFNKKEDIITFWDEPTISLDELSHPLHNIIKKNWKENIIPNMILSSATLPKEEEIHSTVSSFRSKFINSDVHSIVSHDCKKSIPIINKDNEICLPHLLWENYNDLLTCVDHCESYRTILRYFDLNEIVKFILYVNKHKFIENERLFIERYFTDILEVNMYNLKEYYLKVLKNLKESEWTIIFDYFKNKNHKMYESTAYFVTKDAYTLTNGPTIFLAENIEKISKFCIQQAKIPIQIMKEINECIDFNNKLNLEIDKQEKIFEDGTANIEEDSKKMIKDRLTPEMKKIRKHIEDLRNSIKLIELNDLFIPNKKEHIDRWASDKNIDDVFSCNIPEQTIIQIMQLKNVEDTWKVLLLMGIGVFIEHENGDYTQIMKDLAQNQRLFLIIASSNYIYGTNYQFCHGYIGKDLENMTQEKTIQSLGRIGRNNFQQTYSIRFRDNTLVNSLFVKEINKPEVENMNKLFNDDDE